MRSINRLPENGVYRPVATFLRLVFDEFFSARRRYEERRQIDRSGIDLQVVQSTSREAERAEIHMLAQGLGLVTRTSRSPYERAIATFFNGKKTSTMLTDSEHTQFLSILRAWARAKAVIADRATDYRAA